jgi:hypothetical protein
VPFFPYALSSILPPIFPGLSEITLDPFLALGVSAVIAFVLTVIFYRIAVNNARDLLAKAEV